MFEMELLRNGYDFEQEEIRDIFKERVVQALETDDAKSRKLAIRLLENLLEDSFSREVSKGEMIFLDELIELIVHFNLKNWLSEDIFNIEQLRAKHKDYFDSDQEQLSLFLYFYLELLLKFSEELASDDYSISFESRESFEYFKKYYSSLFILQDDKVVKIIGMMNEKRLDERRNHLIENMMLHSEIYQTKFKDKSPFDSHLSETTKGTVEEVDGNQVQSENTGLSHEELLTLVKAVLEHGDKKLEQICSDFEHLAVEIRLRVILKSIECRSSRYGDRVQNLEEKFIEHLRGVSQNDETPFKDDYVKKAIDSWGEERTRDQLQRDYSKGRLVITYEVNRGNIFSLKKQSDKLEDYFNAWNYDAFIPKDVEEGYSKFKEQIKEIGEHCDPTLILDLILEHRHLTEELDKINKVQGTTTNSNIEKNYGKLILDNTLAWRSRLAPNVFFEILDIEIKDNVVPEERLNNLFNYSKIAISDYLEQIMFRIL